MKPKLENSVAWLRARWLAEKKATMQEMAEEAECSVQTIRRRLKEAGLIK
jgi:DeoR/GlpR family transcriptional regulator of sugar metabolism